MRYNQTIDDIAEAVASATAIALISELGSRGKLPTENELEVLKMEVLEKTKLMVSGHYKGKVNE